jgi:hypothetical protein
MLHVAYIIAFSCDAVLIEQARCIVYWLALLHRLRHGLWLQFAQSLDTKPHSWLRLWHVLVCSFGRQVHRETGARCCRQGQRASDYVLRAAGPAPSADGGRVRTLHYVIMLADIGSYMFADIDTCMLARADAQLVPSFCVLCFSFFPIRLRRKLGIEA